MLPRFCHALGPLADLICNFFYASGGCLATPANRISSPLADACLDGGAPTRHSPRRPRYRAFDPAGLARSWRRQGQTLQVNLIIWGWLRITIVYIYTYSLSQNDHWCCFAGDAEEPSEGAAKVAENPRMDLGVLVCPRICQMITL